MEQNKVYLTKEGLANLQIEYKALTEVRRPAAVERLANARNAGDLSENTDYTQAKEDLSFIDGRIAELDEVLANVVIIEESHKNCQQVSLGCRVTIQEGKEKHIFHLVGEWEADPMNKKISHQSPLGKALLGRKVGEAVEVEAPAGKVVYRILSIE